MKLPDFFLIGAARSGTSGLFATLCGHPAIFGSQIKEPNYFALGGQAPRFTGPGDAAGINRRSVWDRDEYASLFADAGEDQIAGEASVIYLGSPQAGRAIRDTIPEPKIIAVLRDPVARAFSAYRYLRMLGREPLEDFREAVAAEASRVAAGWEPLWHYVRLSRYAEQLKDWFNLFPRDRILLIRYENLLESPGEVLSHICGFLGVAPELIESPSWINRSGVPRWHRLHAAALNEGLGKRFARLVLPAGLRRRLWRTLMAHNVRADRVGIAPALELELRARFREDVEKLEGMSGWDLSAWKNSANNG